MLGVEAGCRERRGQTDWGSRQAANKSMVRRARGLGMLQRELWSDSLGVEAGCRKKCGQTGWGAKQAADKSMVRNARGRGRQKAEAWSDRLGLEAGCREKRNPKYCQRSEFRKQKRDTFIGQAVLLLLNRVDNVAIAVRLAMGVPPMLIELFL